MCLCVYVCVHAYACNKGFKFAGCRLAAPFGFQGTALYLMRRFGHVLLCTLTFFVFITSYEGSGRERYI